MAASVDLSSLLEVRTVPVVAAVDSKGLLALLQGLLSGQKSAQQQLQQQAQQIAVLKADTAAAAAAAAAVEQQQRQHDAPPPPPPAAHVQDDARLEALQGQLKALCERLDALEAARLQDAEAQAAASAATAAAAAAAAAAASEHVCNSSLVASAEDGGRDAAAEAAAVAAAVAADAAAPRARDEPPLQLQELRRQQEQLQGALSGLRAELSAATAGLAREVAALQGSKADRSELDVLLASVAAEGMQHTAAGSSAEQHLQLERQQPALADAPDSSTPHHLASNSSSVRRGTREGAPDQLAQQVATLALQLALLQDRINKKADTPTVEELSGGLSSARQQLAQQQLLLQPLSARLADLQDSLANLRGAQHRHTADAGLHRHAGQVPAASDATASVCEQEEVGGSATELHAVRACPAVQLVSSLAHLAALDASVAALQAATEAQPGPQPLPPQRRVSGEAPASGKLVQHLAAQLAELKAHVACLAVPVPPRLAGSSGDGQPDAPASAEAAAGAARPLEDAAAGRSSNDSDAAASGGAGTDSAEAGLASGGQAGPASGAFDVAFAADVDARLADVEALLQDIVAGKVDSNQMEQQLHAHQSMLDHVMRQLDAHHDSIEQLAAAVALMATVQATAARDTPSAASGSAYDEVSFVKDVCDPEPQTPAFSFGGARQWPTAGSALAGLSAAAGGVGPGPHAARLEQLLQSGQVFQHKMDWFDPLLLQKMAQRLAAAEAVLRDSAASSSNAGAGMNASGKGSAAVEAKLKKLAAEVKGMQTRMAEVLARGGTQGGWGARDGDHSMLSGKPLGGMRCLGCARPLAGLIDTSGPHIPGGLMPVSVASGAEAAAGGSAAPAKLPPAGLSSRRRAHTASDGGTGARPMTACERAASPDTSRRGTGPQNWYASAHGLPADSLPISHVGPTLPPGGWRGNHPHGEDGAALPVIRSGRTPRSSAPGAGHGVEARKGS